MKLSVGHNDGYLMLLCLIDGGLQAFQGGRVERGDSVLLFLQRFSIPGLKWLTFFTSQ